MRAARDRPAMLHQRSCGGTSRALAAACGSRARARRSRELGRSPAALLGDTYMDPTFYEPQAVHERLTSRTLHSIGAWTTDALLVGHVAIAVRPWGGNTADAGMTLVAHSHRGYGIARKVAMGLAKQAIALGLVGVLMCLCGHGCGAGTTPTPSAVGSPRPRTRGELGHRPTLPPRAPLLVRSARPTQSTGLRARRSPG